MNPTRSQIDSWNPEALNALDRSWRTLASSVEDLFVRYVKSVEKVEGEYWEGIAAEAVQDRAANDRRTMAGLAERIESLADAMRNGYFAIDAPLRTARATICRAEELGFVVTDVLGVVDPTPDPERDSIRVALGEDLVVAARTAASADRELTDLLATSRSDLLAAFTSAAALGSDQAQRDATALADGTLGPGAVRRLIEAGALSPEQLVLLQSGSTIAIPASQMEYLHTVVRSLDGHSPDELERVLSTVPSDARASLANALQLVSDESVTVATRGDAEVPVQGGLNLLPDGIRDALTRTDLVVHDMQIVGGRAFSATGLNGVADTVAIADVVAAGDAEYRNGSALDRELLDVGRRYLDAQVAHEQHPDSTFRIFTVDGVGTDDRTLTEPIFAAVADDRAAVEHLVTHQEHGADFVRDVLTHQWPDDGATVASMFSFDETDAFVTDPHDPADVADAERTGTIMAAVAESMSSESSWQLLSSIPGTDGESIGQANPELVRTVSHSMSHYIPHLAGSFPDDRPGFHAGDWADPRDNNSFRGSSNVFAALNTDEEAGKHFTNQAFAEATLAEIRYGQDPHSPGTTGNLTTAGRILGMVDRGVLLATQDQYDDEAQQLQAAHDRKANAYNAAVWTGSFAASGNALGAAAFTAISAGGNPLRDMLIGAAPEPGQQAELNAPDFYHHYYVSLAAAEDFPAWARAENSSIFGADGRLLSYSELVTDHPGDKGQRELEDLLREVFFGFGNFHDGHGSALREGYEDAVRANG